MNCIAWATLTLTGCVCEKAPAAAVKLKFSALGVSAVPVTVKFAVPELATVSVGGEKLTPPEAAGAVISTGPAKGALKVTLKVTGAFPPGVSLNYSSLCSKHYNTQYSNCKN